jgi:hypothetical protein
MQPSSVTVNISKHISKGTLGKVKYKKTKQVKNRERLPEKPSYFLKHTIIPTFTAQWKILRLNNFILDTIII